MASTVSERITSFCASLNLSGDQAVAARTGLVIDELDGWTNPADAQVSPTTVSWAGVAAATEPVMTRTEAVTR
ncbi:hypothetical protein CDG81_20690 [Actinopolyspora erythraea]|uniref:Uncharacterized protein n=1 Tax=Actinopolyspora erythraea TaxID=414996 RepID=A0A099D9Q4_9ACTN|nr:hypothetical protein [Actinopolyspora erythraea]ASU80288.1 hypothetical protein CDG81_20690 [Actinopolyspora erythraea]KGI82631.1 hypothetical protein IL38_04185 [Actinopolyspora erythraea]